MNLNMHDIVRGAIEAINEDIDGTVHVSNGRQNVRGILTPTYASVLARLQMQARPHDRIAHERSLEYSGSFLYVYAYGNFSDVERPDGSGGDVVQIPSSSRAGWYYITQVVEWWPDWCSFEVARQLNAATIQQYVTQLANGANP